MINHAELGDTPFRRSRKLKQFIKDNGVVYAGNRKLKIYGTLTCSSGRRMKVANRVFFSTIEEALESGYRPCGHCMHWVYQQWKAGDNC